MSKIERNAKAGVNEHPLDAQINNVGVMVANREPFLWNAKSIHYSSKNVN